ncbi:MAG: hypothetical protein OEM83_07455 [Gammaproteobacteria bacterium]|nr:hypothetical protein [Gammaproteobacteria bacterium]MDH5511718.1 hypothetical protein [Gammaproteobacteria bacterium]
MERRGYDTSKPALSWVTGFWLVSIVAACEPIWATPEGRAREFIEALVMAPSGQEQLRDIANLSPEREPDDLVDGLSARVGLDYLRAMQSREVPLTFVQGESRQTGEARRTVKIHVTYLQPGTPATAEVRFLVRIEKAGGNRWHIARVTGDN